MKKKLIATLAMLMSVGACQSDSGGLSETDISAIKAASHEWVTTYNKNDWDALAKLFSPDATLMPPNSPEVVGRDAISAWEAEYESGFQIAFDVQEIEGKGDLAYVRGRSCVLSLLKLEALALTSANFSKSEPKTRTEIGLSFRIYSIPMLLLEVIS